MRAALAESASPPNGTERPLTSSPLQGATIVFDLDGTLVDSAPDLIAVLDEVLAEEGLAPLPLYEAKPLIGRGARRLIERGFAHRGQHLAAERLDNLHRRFLALYEPRMARLTLPWPGLGHALFELQNAGARLAVCTNKPGGMARELLAQLRLATLFAAIVGRDDVPAPKPDPRHLAAAVEAAGGDTGRAIMVGDSAVDAETARAAKVPLVLVGFGYSDIPAAELSPDALIWSFGDLRSAGERVLPPLP